MLSVILSQLNPASQRKMKVVVIVMHSASQAVCDVVHAGPPRCKISH